MRGRVSVSAVTAGIGISWCDRATAYNRTAVRLFPPAVSASAALAAARASAAVAPSPAPRVAASWHCASVTCASFAPTPGDRRRGRRQRRHPEADQHARQQRIGRGLTADADGLVHRDAGLDRHRDERQHRGLPRIGERREFGRHPVGGHRVLRQVVGADRQEVDVLEDPVGQQRGRGHLDHHAGREAVRTRPAPQRLRASAGVAIIGAITQGCVARAPARPRRCPRAAA